MPNRELFNYAIRGERLSECLARGIEGGRYKNKTEFARLLGIDQSNLNGYLSGKFDPLKLGDRLIDLGIDLNWLATGKRIDEDKTGITDEDIRILIELRLHGVDTVAEVRKLIELRDTMKRMLQTEIRAEPNPLYTEQEQRRYLDNPEFKTKSAVKKEKKTKEHHKS